MFQYMPIDLKTISNQIFRLNTFPGFYSTRVDSEMFFHGFFNRTDPAISKCANEFRDVFDRILLI